MPKEGMRWILCWVFLFYHYYPGCQDAEVPLAAAVYMSLMDLFTSTCILLIFMGEEESGPNPLFKRL